MIAVSQLPNSHNPSVVTVIVYTDLHSDENRTNLGWRGDERSGAFVTMMASTHVRTGVRRMLALPILLSIGAVVGRRG